MPDDLRRPHATRDDRTPSRSGQRWPGPGSVSGRPVRGSRACTRPPMLRGAPRRSARATAPEYNAPRRSDIRKRCDRAGLRSGPTGERHATIAPRWRLGAARAQTTFDPAPRPAGVQPPSRSGPEPRARPPVRARPDPSQPRHPAHRSAGPRRWASSRSPSCVLYVGAGGLGVVAGALGGDDHELRRRA